MIQGNPSTTDDQPDDFSSVLSTDWHPFYDARGVKYYHNFATKERMRQSPRRVPNTEDAGAEVHTPTAQDVAKGLAETQESMDGGATAPGFMTGVATDSPDSPGGNMA